MIANRLDNDDDCNLYKHARVREPIINTPQLASIFEVDETATISLGRARTMDEEQPICYAHCVSLHHAIAEGRERKKKEKQKRQQEELAKPPRPCRRQRHFRYMRGTLKRARKLIERMRGMKPMLSEEEQGILTDLESKYNLAKPGTATYEPNWDAMKTLATALIGR